MRRVAYHLTWPGILKKATSIDADPSDVTWYHAHPTPEIA